MNRYLNTLIHQDAVWKQLFREDNSRNLAIVLQNEWLREKWEKECPDKPIPHWIVCCKSNEARKKVKKGTEITVNKDLLKIINSNKRERND